MMSVSTAILQNVTPQYDDIEILVFSSALQIIMCKTNKQECEWRAYINKAYNNNNNNDNKF